MSKILKYYDQIKPRFTRSCFLLSSCSKNEVHCVKWWMAHYQSSTPKRHYAYCNSHYIHRLDKGVLQGWKKHKDQKVVTAVHYTDASGKKRYKGTKQLRSTETLDLYQDWDPSLCQAQGILYDGDVGFCLAFKEILHLQLVSSAQQPIIIVIGAKYIASRFCL